MASLWDGNRVTEEDPCDRCEINLEPKWGSLCGVAEVPGLLDPSVVLRLTDSAPLVAEVVIMIFLGGEELRDGNKGKYRLRFHEPYLQPPPVFNQILRCVFPLIPGAREPPCHNDIHPAIARGK